MRRLTVSPSEWEAVGGWKQALAWARRRHASVVRLDHYQEPYPYGSFPRMLAAGARELISVPLSNLATARLALPDGRWWFGYIGYEAGRAFHGYPELHLPRLDAGMAWEFFSPEVLIREEDSQIVMEADHPELIWETISTLQKIDVEEVQNFRGDGKPPSSLISPAEYVSKVQSIKHLLQEGEIYELNFCRPVEVFLRSGVEDVFLALQEASPTPFQFYLRTENLEMAGSSPERFLKKMGNRLISQPIKGTAPRGTTPEEDARLVEALRTDEKTIAENMMIADLVRNDLMRVCRSGTVQADEVFGIYSFRNLHQMITTLSGEVPDVTSLWNILAATFPMGSMTGAPKQAALGYIELHEVLARGPFSGAIGWVAPNGDFDFSVIIRSLYRNPHTGRAWLNTGGAIVWDSDPEAELAEAELKASVLLKVLSRG